MSTVSTKLEHFLVTLGFISKIIELHINKCTRKDKDTLESVRMSCENCPMAFSNGLKNSVYHLSNLNNIC